MQPSNTKRFLYAAFLFTLLAGCSESKPPVPVTAPTSEVMPPSPPPTTVGEASGSLKLMVKNHDPANGNLETVDFNPKFAYAYPENVDGQRLVWLVVSDQAPDPAILDAAEDRSSALERWCHDKHAPYLARAIDAHGVVTGAINCKGRDKDFESKTFYTDGANAGKVELTLNEQARIEGQMHAGHFATGDYHFVANVAPLSLWDRVLTTGKADATGVPGAKDACLNYFRAFNAAKTEGDLVDWYTPEKRSSIDPSVKIDPFPSPTISSAKALGAAAIVDSEIVFPKSKFVCQTLLLQLEGKWKIGRDHCVGK
jgi:hypothetical protein